MKRIVTFMAALLLMAVSAGAQNQNGSGRPVINKQNLARQLEMLQRKADSLQARLDTLQFLQKLDQFGQRLDSTEFIQSLDRLADTIGGKLNELETNAKNAASRHPGFNGGPAGNFSYWVADNLITPAYVQGSVRVPVSFLIDVDGSVKDVKVVRTSNNPELDSEAVRCVGASPRWDPARDDSGNPVPFTCSFTVIFHN